MTIAENEENKSIVCLLDRLYKIVLNLFNDWMKFAYKSYFGFIFTVSIPILGVVAFVALSQFNMHFIAGMVLAGTVFGDITLGLIAGKLQKHGFFKCCGVDGSSGDELSSKPAVRNN